MEAKCYYKIGAIHEKMEELEKAVEYVEKFLEICKNDGESEQSKNMIGKAYKKLAELHSKLGNASAAILNLEELFKIAQHGANKQGQAEAALKLGLLNYKEGLIPTSVNYLLKHFEIAKHMGNGSLIDTSRVNLGIAKANGQIDNYFKQIMSDAHSVIDFLNEPKQN